MPANPSLDHHACTPATHHKWPDIHRATPDRIFGEDQRIHLGVDNDIVLELTNIEAIVISDRARKTVIAAGDDFVSQSDHKCTRLCRRVLRGLGDIFGDLEPVLIPPCLTTLHSQPHELRAAGSRWLCESPGAS